MNIETLLKNYSSLNILTFISNNAFEISLNENKNQQLGLNDISGQCFLMNIWC